MTSAATRPMVLVLSATIGIMAAAAPARAYDAATTHAGLTEQAAIRDHFLHHYLKQVHDLPLGIFEPVKLQPKRERFLLRASLILHLSELDAAHGYRPSPKQVNRALHWLAAGTVLEDMPFTRGRHHYLDPRTGKGLKNAPGNWGLSIRMRWLDYIEGDGPFGGIFTGSNFNLNGKSVLTWARHRYNDYSLKAHLRHRRRALEASTRSARRHHLAMSLITAGALLHLLQEMAVPAKVRNDFIGAYLVRQSTIGVDYASPYERLVTRKYGRLGVPAAKGALPRFVRFNDYFANKNKTGLADRTQRRFFSRGSLPKTLRMHPRMTPRTALKAVNASVKPPGPPIGLLDLQGARGNGRYWGNGDNPYQLAYRVNRKGELMFAMDDTCHAAAAKRLLPEAARYSASLLHFLLRGRLTLKPSGKPTEAALVVTHTGPTLKAGTLSVLWEDAKGVRKLLKRVKTAAGLKTGQRLAQVPIATLPKGARQVVVSWTGVDAAGEPLVMGGRWNRR